MKIIIFYIFLILIFIPIIFNSIFITRTVEGFKGEKKEKKKKNKEVIYKMIGDSFIYGKNTIEILPSNKKDKITDLYFHYRSLPDKSIANGNTFDDISSQEFIVKTPKNKYKISFSSSKKPITIILNETEYMIELEKKDKEGKFDILWFNKVVGTIDGFDIKLTEKKLDDVEVVMVLYTAILIIQKMKDLDNVDYNKMFK
jgi:hypothetical protein